jgi:hypothetical protein
MGLYTKQRARKAPAPTVQTDTVPASTGGINALAPLISMPPQDCIYCDNLMPSEYGMRLRKGYIEWANGLGAEARTILPFEGQTTDSSANRLWAITENGIYNVSLFNTTAPVQDQAFSVQGDAAGYGVSTEFTSDSTDRYLFYADEANGLFQYAEETGLWTVPAITGPVVANIAFVMTWKNRIWMVENNSGDAWYLPPNAIAGPATKFTFGSKFTYGGDLRGLWSWTIDGGSGIDDYMIAISHGGDVLAYQGMDVEAAAGNLTGEFFLVGSFFIGETPSSRRLTVAYGGELYMLSSYGVTSVRDLLQGSGIVDVSAQPSAKISRFLRQLVQDNTDAHNWSLMIHPADGFLQIITPPPTNTPYLQYNQNLLTKAWGRWSEVPVNCAQTWNGDYFFGTLDGQVYIYDGVLDDTLLDGTLGQPINFDVLTSFVSPGPHMVFKRVSYIRTIGVLAGTAAINVKAVYDYDVGNFILAPPQLPTAGGSLWDQAIWDDDVWDYGLIGANFPVGALGIGRSIAVGMKGSSATRLNVLGWDISYTTGSLM